MSGMIQVNGKDAPLAATVAELVGRLALKPGAKGIAVALNGRVVPRSVWESTPLAAGDAVEVIRALSGG